MTQSTVECPKTDVAETIKKVPVPMLILHVDDDASFLTTAKPVLEMQGAFQVETASSVEEATEKMKKNNYDAIVCDYVMPGKDGLQFLKQLRDGGNNIPFIIFTGKSREEVAIRALNLGADYYINKFGNPEMVYSELAHSIRKIVRAKKAERDIMIKDSAIAASINAIAFADLDGNLTFVNDSFLKLWKYDDREVLGKPVVRFWQLEEKAAEVVEALKTKGSWMGELVARRKDGSTFFAYLSASVVKDETGKPLCMMSSVMDITESKKAQEALKESEERYRSMVEQAPDLIVTVDEKGIVTSCNSAVEGGSGYSREEIIGKHFLKSPLTRGIDATHAQELFSSIIEGKPLEPIDVIWYRKDGTSRLSEIRISLMKKEGRTVGFTAIARDITERKRIEEELTRSEEKYRSLVEMAPDSIMTFDMKGVITSVNSASTRLAGYSKDELVGKHFTKIGAIRVRDMPKYLQMFSSTLRGTVPKPFEVVYHHKDGTPRLGEVRFSFIKEMGKIVGLQAIMRDITESKKAGEAIRESEEKFKNIFESVGDGLIYLNTFGRVLDVNRKAVEIFGGSKEEVLGKHFTKVGIFSLKDVPTLMKNFTGILRRKKAVLNVTMKNKNGQVIPLECSASLLKVNDKSTIAVVARDITERKKTLEKLKVLNEKLGVVGGLTRHDIRNKLSIVTNNIYLAKQTLSNDHKSLAYLENIESVCEQSKRILDFSAIYEQLGVEELAFLDVGKSVDEAVLLSQLQGVKVVNDCHGLTVMADSLLRQLFYNLIDNSLKHGKRVSQIRASYKDGKDEQKLVFEDDGVGIPKSEKDKIFKKDYEKGSMHGLYMIRKMCEVYGWTIQETGIQGKGAQFTITIPKILKND